MSGSSRAAPRRLTGGPARLLILALALPLVSSAAHGLASAEPPPAAARLTAAEARAAGSTISVARRTAAGSAIVEVQPGSETAASRILAASPDGRAVALAAAPAAADGTLLIAFADGAQLRVHLPGVGGAAFSPTGDTVAAIDGQGCLWLVDTRTGAARRVPAGPFGGSPLLGADGSILALAVSSVEAPIESRAVRVDPAGGQTTPLSDDALVYAIAPLDRGGLAMTVHEPGRTLVRRVDGQEASVLADLGPDATAVSVSSDGRRIAFQRGSRGVFVIEAPGQAARRIGAGTSPQLSPDGASLLLQRDGGTLLASLDGGAATVALAPLATFIGCEGGCLP